MVVINLKNVDVQFPFTPYELQKDMMTAMIDSAQQKSNALIDSPTGTGKTICLLTSLLAWREAYCEWKKALKNPDFINNTALLKPLHAKTFGPHIPFLADRDIDEPIPKIYYASRTHSQLSQVTGDLKRSPYNPQTVLLASREQLCVNESLGGIRGAELTAKCKSLTKANQCQYYFGAEKPANMHEFKHTIMDIEDIGNYSKSRKSCGYFLTVDAMPDAHIVFLPYQYLIDERTRESQKINVSNSIIVFDEGHNVEGVCTESTSAEVSVSDLFRSVSELNLILKEFRDGDVNSRLESSDRIEESEVKSLYKAVQKFATCMASVAVPKNADRNCVQAGVKIYDYLKESGLDEVCDAPQRAVEVMLSCEKVVNYIDPKKKQNGGKSGLGNFIRFFRLLKTGTLVTNPSLIKYYKLNVQEKQAQSNQAHTRNMMDLVFERIISMNCLSAEVAMAGLANAGSRSIIFASGTLSPLESFASEYGLEFKNRVENPHVIKKDQIFVASVPRGPSNKELNSSFTKRDSESYVAELGRSILNILQGVPDGVLVFFSSYSLLENTVLRWKAAKIWTGIMKSKQAFVESKDKQEFKSLIENYEKCVSDKKGAVFFAVCRGKASEGIDFSDGKARAVIICGIPFPNHKEPKVEQKMSMLNAGMTFNNKGKAWYDQQAFRALNQAIGRAIRHRNDFGAVFLLDERFSAAKNVANLPLWIRSDVIQYKGFGPMLKDSINFFKYHKDGKRDDSLLPKQSTSVTIQYGQSGNGALMINNRNNIFHDPLQLINIAPVNKTDIDVLKIEKAWNKGKQKVQPEIKSNNTVDNPVAKRTVEKIAVLEKAQFKERVENFSVHLVAPVIPSSSNDSILVHVSDTNNSTELATKKRRIQDTEAELDDKKRRNALAITFFERMSRQLTKEQTEEYKDILTKYKKKRYTQKELIAKTARFLFNEISPTHPQYLVRFSLFEVFEAFVGKDYLAQYKDTLERYRPR